MPPSRSGEKAVVESSSGSNRTHVAAPSLCGREADPADGSDLSSGPRRRSFRSRGFVDLDGTWRFLDRMTEPPGPDAYARRLPASIVCRDHLRTKRLTRPSPSEQREGFRSPLPGGPILEPRRMRVRG